MGKVDGTQLSMQAGHDQTIYDCIIKLDRFYDQFRYSM